MSEDVIFKKSLAIFIIILLVQVSCLTTIKVKASLPSTKDDSVDLTVEPIGINGIKPLTTRLTKQQVASFEHSMGEIGRRLQNAGSKKEYYEILNEAIHELDRFGLLPKGMTIASAEALLTRNDNSQATKAQRNLLSHFISKINFDFDNVACVFFSPGGTCSFDANPIRNAILVGLTMNTLILSFLVDQYSLYREMAKPLNLFSTLEIVPDVTIPYSSLGLKGIKNGDLISDSGYNFYYMSSIIGFTGFTIHYGNTILSTKVCCLGTALALSLNSKYMHPLAKEKK